MPELRSPGRLDPEFLTHRRDSSVAGLILPAAVMTGLFGALLMLVG